MCQPQKELAHRFGSSPASAVPALIIPSLSGRLPFLARPSSGSARRHSSRPPGDGVLSPRKGKSFILPRPSHSLADKPLSLPRDFFFRLSFLTSHIQSYTMGQHAAGIHSPVHIHQRALSFHLYVTEFDLFFPTKKRHGWMPSFS